MGSSVHILPWLSISNSLYRADWVSDLHVWLLCGVCGVEGLIIGEPIQVLVVLVVNFKVVFTIRICLEIVE